MRRTKESKTKDGKNIIDLPEKHYNLIKCILSEEERLMYDHIE